MPGEDRFAIIALRADPRPAGSSNGRRPLHLETRKLVKEFKGFVAVSDDRLAVRRGQIHALIGPNGAGKTTVFNLLTKFLIPTRGQILYKGQDITPEKPARGRRRRGIVRSFPDLGHLLRT